MLKIPFYKPSIGTEEIDEVVATLKSGWLTTGPKTKKFEREFADHLRHKHAIAVNSCTAALHLALAESQFSWRFLVQGWLRQNKRIKAGENPDIPAMK
jgi:dTDP-4-amino-4,6-dideoxygalactose transaminase